MTLESTLARHDVRILGEVAYQEAYDLQKKLQQQRIRDEIPDTTLLLTHPHVYTMGAADIEVSTLIKEELPAPLVITDRGGKITYHGPGQLVAYFIHKLPDTIPATRAFVDEIENITILTLNTLGIQAYTRKNEVDSYGNTIRGAWVTINGNHRKIAAQGVGTNRYPDIAPGKVTMHGFALNVHTDLSYFTKIHPCGFTYNAMTTMQETLGRDVQFEGVQEKTKTIIQNWRFAHHE